MMDRLKHTFMQQSWRWQFCVLSINSFYFLVICLSIYAFLFRLLLSAKQGQSFDERPISWACVGNPCLRLGRMLSLIFFGPDCCWRWPLYFGFCCFNIVLSTQYSHESKQATLSTPLGNYGGLLALLGTGSNHRDCWTVRTVILEVRSTVGTTCTLIVCELWIQWSRKKGRNNNIFMR